MTTSLTPCPTEFEDQAREQLLLEGVEIEGDEAAEDAQTQIVECAEQLARAAATEGRPR